MILPENVSKCIDKHMVKIAKAFPSTGWNDTRDWSGFFSALLEALKELAPIILPLILKTASQSGK